MQAEIPTGREVVHGTIHTVRLQQGPAAGVPVSAPAGPSGIKRRRDAMPWSSEDINYI